MNIGMGTKQLVMYHGDLCMFIPVSFLILVANAFTFAFNVTKDENSAPM